MSHHYLKNLNLNIETLVIETPRCTIEPFRVERIDFRDLTEAFLGANENLYVSEYLPNVEQEREFIASTIDNRRN